MYPLPPIIRSAVAVVKSDTTVFDPPASGFYVGVTGDVVVRMNGSNVTFKAVPAGTTIWVLHDQIRAATTATDILRLGV